MSLAQFVKNKYANQVDSFTLDMLESMIYSDRPNLVEYYSTIMFPNRSASEVAPFVEQDLAEQYDSAVRDIIRIPRQQERERQERVRKLYMEKMGEIHAVTSLGRSMDQLTVLNEDSMTDDM